MRPNCSVRANPLQPTVSVRPQAAADRVCLILPKPDLRRAIAVSPVSRVSYRLVFRTRATSLQLNVCLLAGMPKFGFEFAFMDHQ